MNLGPSELGSRSEGTGNTGEKLRLVAELEVRRGANLVPIWGRVHPDS